jgi:signal transduction histidine kinase
LDNYDKDWVDAGARREAFYSKLPPGSYTFHVIAVNDAGVWNNTGATVSFSVAPTLVQKAWFRIGILLTLIALAILVFRVRLNLSRRRLSNEMFRILEERQRIARDLHDTLLQSMQSLMFKFAVATEKLDTDDPVRPIFEATLEQSDQVLLEGRHLIISLHSKEEPSNVLLDSLRKIGEELRPESPVTQFVAESHGIERQLGSIANHELCAIGREALTNAFRHANAAHVRLTLNTTSTELTLIVRDDGCGIDEEILEQGYRPGHRGLLNIRERAERLGANYSLRSSPEVGTTMEVIVPGYIAYSNAPSDLRTKIAAIWPMLR